MAYHPQEMTNMCIYGKALDYFKAEVSWLKYLMSPPEDFDTIAPADQIEEVDSEGENNMLISTCMTHNTANDGGVEAMVQKWFFTCVNINWSGYLQNGAREIHPCGPLCIFLYTATHWNGSTWTSFAKTFVRYLNWPVFIWQCANHQHFRNLPSLQRRQTWMITRHVCLVKGLAADVSCTTIRGS